MRLPGQPTPGSVPSPSRAQSLSCAARRSLRAFAVAALAFAALMGFSATAQAQTDVLSATLTVKDLGGSLVGCSNAVAAGRCSDFLSEDEFTYDSTDYAVYQIVVRSDGSLEIRFATNLAAAAQTLTLDVAGATFDFVDAATKTASGRTWSNSGLSWSVGDPVVVKLTATPGIRVSTTMLSVEEGAIRGNSYTVRLDTQPTGNVTVTITGQAGTNLTVTSSPLTFTSTDWNQEQTVQLGAAANNNPAEETVTLRHAATGGGYDSVSPVEVRVTITQPATAPGVPRTLTATPGDGEVVLTWTAPASDGGETITRYEYRHKATSSLPFVSSDSWTSAGTARTATVGSLTNGTPYSFEVRAVNTVGEGTAATASATPMAAVVMNNPATGSPAITGTAQVGQSLYASLGSVADADGPIIIVASYQWIRVDGATETDITGATITPYTPVADDVGKQLKVRLSFTDDLGNPESRTSAATATVAAAGNNAPEFTEGASTTRSIAENTASGQPIGGPVAARDADSGDTLRYTLGGTDMASFAIVSTSGQLQTKAALDYETKSSYAVTISVSDGNGGSDSIDVTVTVTNVDEAGTVTLSAAQPVVDTALTAALTDPDGSLFGVSWVWHKSADLNTWGSAITGAVSASYTPVADDVGQYLRATASYTDGEVSGGTKSAQAVSANAVAAPANNAPEFTEGTSTTRSVAENTASSQNIGTAIAARDADSADTLRYTLGGTDFKSFGIHLNTGQLLTLAALDFETKSSYAVSVSVSDGNGGSDSIGVTITVTDVNEQPGRPAAPSVGATANSDTSLDVSWAAPGLNGGPAITGYNLQYRQGTSGSFTNGPQNVSGTSTMITGLTAGTSYQVQVRADNGETPSDWSPAGTGSTSSTAQPTLTLDVGSNRFSEAAGSVQICVVPSAPSNQRITVQVATADGTATAPGDYVAHSGMVALQPQQQRACFTVTLVDDADAEGDETFTVTLSNPVNATLGGARAVATITIVDNENVAPTFTEGTSTTRSVAENTPSGANIGAPVAATDADSGDTLEYTLGGTDFKSFGIHLNTGQLLTQAALDYETKSSYAVTVSVSDGNGGSDSIEVTITVTDVDESGGGGGDDGDDGDDRPRTSAPGAVRDLTVAGGDGQVVLSWDAPASDDGAAITDYEYRYRTGGSYGAWISTGSTDTTHTVTGLVNGTAYSFQVRAVNRVGKGRTSNRADAAPGGGLGFAHFANGEAITSDLVFVNVAPQPVQPALYFYDKEGNPIDPGMVVEITGDLAVAEDGALTVLTAMEPLGELTISTHGQGELVSGSVQAVTGGPIGGLLRFDLPGIGVAGVGASQPVRDALFPVRRREGGINTGVAIHNLEEEAIVVSCRLMSEGTVLETAEIPLAANGQTSWFIDAAFPGTDTSDFAGSVHCDAPGRRPFAGWPWNSMPSTASSPPCRWFLRIGQAAAGRQPWALRISPMGMASPPIWCS